MVNQFVFAVINLLVIVYTLFFVGVSYEEDHEESSSSDPAEHTSVQVCVT